MQIFTDYRIKIIDIANGCYHNLVLDDQGRIYSFGYNLTGQCGDGSTDRVRVPKLIETLKDYEVVEIKCGTHMSYCRTKCGKNFLWGSNGDNECMNSASSVSSVKIPYQIDDAVKNQCNAESIVRVFPGYACTKIIVS